MGRTANMGFGIYWMAKIREIIAGVQTHQWGG